MNDIGFIGLGRMGGSMARRLMSVGVAISVYSRNARSTQPLGLLGAHVAADIAALCQRANLIITMLPDDEVLESVVTGPNGLTSSLRPGSIHMVGGTHGVHAMERVAAAHARHGQTLVACTVLGRPERALEGKLGLIPAGPAAAIETITPVLQQLGETIFPAGEEPLAAVAVKIANNFVLGCAIEAIGEAMALVRRYGVDAELFQEVLTKGLFNCIAYQVYADVIAKQDWARVGSTATIGLKDAQLALEAAEKVGVPLPGLSVWRDHLVGAIGRGEQALDWAVMAREQFRESGLEPTE